MSGAVRIRAYHQREERYQGLQLDYNGSAALKSEILDAIALLSAQTGLTPICNEYSNASIYIEFHDEYDRDGGTFFSDLLQRLGIKQCERC